MIHSIQQFLENGIDSIEKVSEDFICNPTDYASFIQNIGNETNKLALSIIAETLNDIDQGIKNSRERKKKWSIIKTDDATLITSLGTVKYRKTLYKSKMNGTSCYLIDKVMNKEKSEKFSPDALARIYDEACDSCFRKSGENVCINQEFVSPQTAMNKVHGLEFPKYKSPEKKKKVKYLYVSADEDHVALQFNNSKGDLSKGENGYKINTAISKLVYVYEGREVVSEGQKKRYELKGVRYFSGLYEGRESNRKLWEEIDEYIDGTYEIEEDGRIFVISDGGGWINTAQNVLGSKACMIIDEFHMEKYINKLANTASDAKDDVYEALRTAAYEADQKECSRVIKETKEYVSEVFKEDLSESNKRQKRIAEAETYLKSNWKKIEARKENAQYLHGCSAEGHVSHVLSARLSSRPLGWSKAGIDSMSKLRAYKANGGDMLELAEYQRRRTKTEELQNQHITMKDLGLTAAKMNGKDEASKEKYYELFQARIPGITARKSATIRLNIVI